MNRHFFFSTSPVFATYFIPTTENFFFYTQEFHTQELSFLPVVLSFRCSFSVSISSGMPAGTEGHPG